MISSIQLEHHCYVLHHGVAGLQTAITELFGYLTRGITWYWLTQRPTQDEFPVRL